jgi:hypothetical protein
VLRTTARGELFSPGPWLREGIAPIVIVRWREFITLLAGAVATKCTPLTFGLAVSATSEPAAAVRNAVGDCGALVISHDNPINNG